MNKTISIQSHDRPSDLYKALQYLSNCRGLDEYTVYGFVDPGVPESDECYTVLKNSDIVKETTMYKTNKGLREGNYSTYQIIFEDIESDYNIHIEEDILPGPDSLKYFDFCLEHFDNITQVATGWTQNIVNNNDSNLVHRRIGLACWLWSMTKDFYFNHAKPALDDPDLSREGWAINIFRRLENKDMYEFFPERRITKNIGIGGGVHPNDVENHRLIDNLKNWTGENFEPTYEFELCSKNSRCEMGESVDHRK